MSVYVQIKCRAEAMDLICSCYRVESHLIMGPIWLSILLYALTQQLKGQFYSFFSMKKVSYLWHPTVYTYALGEG